MFAESRRTESRSGAGESAVSTGSTTGLASPRPWPGLASPRLASPGLASPGLEYRGVSEVLAPLAQEVCHFTTVKSRSARKVRRFTTVKWTLARQSSILSPTLAESDDLARDTPQKVAEGHGRIGHSTGLGKELGLVYIYIYIYIYTELSDVVLEFLNSLSARLRHPGVGAFVASSARSAPFLCHF